MERLKESLIQGSTGGAATIDDTEYRRVRKALLQHPALGPLCPDWLRRAATHPEAESRIRDEAGETAGKWHRRRTLIADTLNPLIDALEASDAMATDALERMERLGGGGFGEVYRYRHKLLDTHFAVKILSPVFAGESDHAMERFFREARILFRLQHNHIVRVYDVGLIGRRPFIRMELIEGRSLGRIIQDAGGLSVVDARHAAHSLASALAHAHDEVHVVHRDLKPSNVMREETGRLVVVDFGLGAFVEGEMLSRITRTGEAAASGLYAAPELVADPKLLDARTDIYSFGAIWYEMLTGRAPAGTRIEAGFQDLIALRGAEIEIITQCLGPIASRPSAAHVRDKLATLL